MYKTITGEGLKYPTIFNISKYFDHMHSLKQQKYVRFVALTKYNKLFFYIKNKDSCFV